MKRILICGGISFSDEELFNKTLDEMINKENTILVSGHAKGADTFAELYAEKHGIDIKIFPPEWSKYGRAAGPIRNKQMLDYISKADENLVIAFWNGQSKGTKHTVETANKMGIKVQIIYYSV